MSRRLWSVPRCFPSAPRTCGRTSVSTSTGRSSTSTQHSGWPATVVSAPWPLSSRPSTAPPATSSSTPARAWTHYASWCLAPWRSSKTMRSSLFLVSLRGDKRDFVLHPRVHAVRTAPVPLPTVPVRFPDTTLIFHVALGTYKPKQHRLVLHQ